MNGESIDCIADTSAIIFLSRQEAETVSILQGRNFALTFVTLAELSLGVLKARNQNAAWSRIQDVIRNRPMLQISPMTPAIYARIYYDLEQRGTMIPINDIWIAACAVEGNLPIVARDEHFSRVAGVQVIAC